MSIQHDDKGKIFTNVIRKDPIKVIIQTNKHILFGTYHKGMEERLVDSIINNNQFVVLTDVKIQENFGGEPKLESSFIVLNKKDIIWMVPASEKGSGNQHD